VGPRLIDRADRAPLLVGDFFDPGFGGAVEDAAAPQIQGETALSAIAHCSAVVGAAPTVAELKVVRVQV
jgi:hypothetical protein